MLQRGVLLFFLLARLFQQIPISDAKVPAIIVFGDSTVDSGNNNRISTVLKSNFKPYGRNFDGGPTGRFSNGRIPPDFMAEAFGIKKAIPAYLDPAYNISDFATGVCFASAGTGYDNATSDVLSVIPFWRELDYFEEYQNRLKSFLGHRKAHEVLGEALYLISIGTNDFLENYYLLPQRRSQYSTDAYETYLVGIARDFLIKLYKLGGRKISISGLAPIGCLPLERTTNIFYGSECVEEYNTAARNFNTKLQNTVGKLNTELVGIQIVFSNPYGIVSEILNNPTSFGFENVRSACCGTGYFEMSYLCDSMNPFTCSDADKYVFWDSFHPTEKMNSIIASYILKHDLSQFVIQ